MEANPTSLHLTLDINQPVIAVQHGYKLVLRDALSNLTVGIGTVLKYKPLSKDRAQIRKEYESSLLKQRLKSTFQKLKIL